MKTNEWMEEKIPIKVRSLDDKGQLQEKTEWHTQKVVYIDAKPTRLACDAGGHNWYVIDTHKYLYGCRNCRRKVIAFPVTYKFDNGKLIHKATGDLA